MNKNRLMVNSESSTQSIVTMVNKKAFLEELNSPSVQEVSFFGSTYRESSASYTHGNEEGHDLSDKSCKCKLF